MLAPSMIRDAAAASATPVALATKGTVREARGLASGREDVLGQGELDVHQPAHTDPLGELAGGLTHRSISASPSVAGGRAQAESPE